MIEVRCPKCGKLLGRYEGRGEVQCPRCRGNTIILFDTEKKKTEIRAPRAP